MVTWYLLDRECNGEEISRGKREDDIAFCETLKKNLSAIDPEVMSFPFFHFRTNLDIGLCWRLRFTDIF